MEERATPWGLQWRTSTRFITAVVDFSVFMDVVLYGALVPVFPFVLQDRVAIHEDEIQTSVSQLLAAYAVGSLFTNPFVGFLSDRAASRRTHFLLGLFLLILSTFFVAVARTYSLMILARVLQGASSAVAWTVGLAVLADTLPTEQLGVAMGTIGSVVSFAMVSSPVIGGAIFHAFGFHAVFWFLGAMLVIDVLLRLLMIERKDAIRWGYVSDEETTGVEGEDAPLLTNESNEESQGEPVEPKSVIRLLLSPRFITACWMALIQSAILGGPFDAVLPLHLKKIFDFTPLTIGAMFAALAIPEVVLGPVAGWIVDNYGSKWAGLIGFTPLCPAMFLLVLPTGPATLSQISLFVGLLLLAGSGTSMIGAPAMTEITLQLRSGGSALEGNGYATGYGWFNVAYSIGIMFGPLVSGWIVEKWGWTELCFIMGALAGFTIIPIMLFAGGLNRSDSNDTDN